jgi:drug/metabolite transporter (DMT)-like permease
VTYLPLADTVTFYLAAPIYVTALSAIFLKEQVGWRRWSAVAVGFIGVMIALRPSAATLTWPALIAIVGSSFFAVFLIITRMLRGTSDVRDGRRTVRRHAVVSARGRAVRLDRPSGSTSA